ncbi:secretory carrier-associated membrane, partial [Olea europaea subsp. europaea]
MAGSYDSNPFGEDEVNPFANPGSDRPAANTGLSPLRSEPAGYGRSTTVDIPLDRSKDLKKKEKELQTKEAELKKREQ